MGEVIHDLIDVLLVLGGERSWTGLSLWLVAAFAGSEVPKAEIVVARFSVSFAAVGVSVLFILGILNRGGVLLLFDLGFEGGHLFLPCIDVVLGWAPNIFVAIATILQVCIHLFSHQIADVLLLHTILLEGSQLFLGELVTVDVGVNLG